MSWLLKFFDDSSKEAAKNTNKAIKHGEKSQSIDARIAKIEAELLQMKNKIDEIEVKVNKYYDDCCF